MPTFFDPLVWYMADAVMQGRVSFVTRENHFGDGEGYGDNEGGGNGSGYCYTYGHYSPTGRGYGYSYGEATGNGFPTYTFKVLRCAYTF
jgi:hypothetical protein